MSTSNTNGYKSIQDALDLGVLALEEGDLQSGEKAFSWVLKKDPENTAAWLWLACCAPEERAREECYKRASSINSH